MAVVDSEFKRKAIANHLDNVRHYYHDVNMVYIGLRKLVMWKWLGGSNISSNCWHRGEPDDLKFEGCALVMRRSSAWKLAQGQCSRHGFLCETNERKYFLSNMDVGKLKGLISDETVVLVLKPLSKFAPSTY